MAGLCGPIPAVRLNRTNRRPQSTLLRLRHTWRCSATPNKTPRFLKLAVSGVTELLRLLSFSGNVVDEGKDGDSNKVSVSCVDDIVTILRSDYEDAYFLTGNFTSAIYAEECIFEDPTIRFQGKELYSRNLKLLVPFFDLPVIELRKIEKGVDNGRSFVLATWRLRTFLKLPWRPLISVEGSTLYDLDDWFMIVRHVESWNISALEAIGQILTPSSASSNDGICRKKSSS